MSSFWSAWVIILTSITIILTTWLLLANRKTTNSDPDATTGHVYDGIEEYDKPLPGWWMQGFIITIVFAIGYLIAYPGMGNWKGLLGWTQVGQWQAEMDAADKKYGEIFAKYSATPVEELVKDPKALKMGQRMFANNCAQCHGSDARGSFGFPNLADNDWLYGGSPETIKATLINGRNGAMPAWGAVLGEKGTLDTSAYVMALSGRETSRGDAEAGAKSFGMFCASCHGADGKGNYAFGAPNLTDNIWLYGGSQGQILQTLISGRAGKMPAHQELLSADKIHMLTAYVYSLSQSEESQ